MACTLTAVTTSSANAWAMPSNQNERVRTAWAAVKSGPPPASPAASRGASVGTPSMVSPTSAGLRRTTLASGQPTTRITRPEASAVVRQPTCCIDQPTSGTASPPAARPNDMMDSARARRRWKKWTRATDRGK
jgi:hypothetical protein